MEEQWQSLAQPEGDRFPGEKRCIRERWRGIRENIASDFACDSVSSLISLCG